MRLFKAGFSFLFALSFLSPSLAKDTTVVFLGDSLTEGLGVNPDQAFPALIGKEFEKAGKKISVVNSGISGSTSTSAPARMKKILTTNPDWVVLALGANDGLRGLSVDTMKKNLETSIDLALAQKVKVMLVGMRMPPNYGQAYGKQFEKVFADLAKKYPTVLYLPFLLDKVAGDPTLNMPDGIHPNVEGHKVLATLVFNVLRKKI